MIVNVCPQDDIACGRHTLSRVLSHRTLEREEDRQEETKVFQKNWAKTKMGYHSLNGTHDMNTSIRESIKYGVFPLRGHPPPPPLLMENRRKLS